MDCQLRERERGGGGGREGGREGGKEGGRERDGRGERGKIEWERGNIEWERKLKERTQT